MGRASRRYPLLDPLRGVAATLVVLDHAAGLKIGYFAVLIFFVISGYCILASAEAGLSRGMTIGEYMKRRFRRIYPPYIISVLFYLATRLVKAHFTGNFELASRTWLEWVQTVTLTQWVTLVHGLFMGVYSYPYNNYALMVAAHWSLNYEEQFYLFVGVVMVACARLRLSLPAVLLPFTVATTLLMVAFPTLVVGLLVDYWPLFGAGAVVYFRLTWQAGPERRALDVGLGLAFAASAGVLAIFGRPWPEHRYFWEDLAVASGLAIVLVLLRPLDARLMATLPLRLLKKVGTISYSLYLIHQFNMSFGHAVVDRLVGAGAWRPLHVALEVGFQWALASVFYRLFERPFLNAPLEAAAPPAVTAA